MHCNYDYNLSMSEIVLIDGNNLLHAVRQLGPTRPPGREKLARLIEGWAALTHNQVVLVFDGPAPGGPFGKQMQSQAVEIVFSGARTADDCIVERLQQVNNPSRAKVVTDDTAIRYEARSKQCGLVSTTAFIASLFAAPSSTTSSPPSESPSDKPTSPSDAERQAWLDIFDDRSPEEPFDGHEAMQF